MQELDKDKDKSLYKLRDFPRGFSEETAPDPVTGPELAKVNPI